MNKKIVFQAATIASIISLVAVVIILFPTFSLESKDVQVQPIEPIDAFLEAATEHTNTTMTFFFADSLFILSYLMVFVGLYTVTSERARTFALIGMGAGVMTALMDATENAHFLYYVFAARNDVAIDEPNMMQFFVISNLKWMSSFATLYAFGLVFPRNSWFERGLTAFLLIFPLVGLLSIFNADFVMLRSVLFVVGFIGSGRYFWQLSQDEE